jgi:hypothetical protein
MGSPTCILPFIIFYRVLIYTNDMKQISFESIAYTGNGSRKSEELL